KMFLHWPGPVTFVVPASTLAPFWITGKFNTVAIRISKHIPIIQLCRMFGKAIVSTSANVSSMPPCLTRSEVFKQFGKNFPLLDGNIGHQKHPSSIINIINGQSIRNVKK
ncbi:Sua5/YciO/YrdC/YwlC family protein, partial [Buchnera aphidicola]|nr:Sua5/YciO/YrdC/YwlC family protein [Buchnera aphidicola]